MKSFFSLLGFLFLIGCATTPKRGVVNVDSFTFIGVPKSFSEKTFLVDVVKVTAGSFTERQIEFPIGADQTPLLKIGVEYSITAGLGMANDGWLRYKILNYHEVK